MTIAAVPRRDTQRHRGEADARQGDEAGDGSPSSPKGGTHPHVVAHDSVDPSRAGGLTPRLHIAPIASISHPHEFRG
jgi:hypothetical protein